MAEAWRIDPWLNEHGDEGYALWAEDVVCLLHERDFAPIATAVLDALRAHDPAAHRALVAEAAREAGLTVLDTDQSLAVQRECPMGRWDHAARTDTWFAALVSALRGEPTATERSGEHG